jgi:hypothetical protein
MSETTVTYNGVTLRQVRITEFRIENPSNFGSPSSGILLHSVSGEALVFNETGDSTNSNSNFVTKMIESLNQPRKALRIRIIDQSNQTFTIVDTTQGGTSALATDAMNGPFFRANVTQITGTNALMVNFTVEYARTASSLNKIKSFYCTASFSIDEMGMTTVRKTGSLQMSSAPEFTSASNNLAGLASDRAGSVNTATEQDRYVVGDAGRSDVVIDFITSHGVDAVFADYYRRFVSGNLYRGFRRMRQEYAIDESRTRLIFDVTDQEFSRGLPAPARVGNCSYTFERSLEDNQLLGIKHFIASVKGDRNVTAGALLTLCIRLSQNRIDWREDLIVKIRVTEENMLTENAITFEVVSKGAAAQSYVATSTQGNESRGEVTPILDYHSLPGAGLLRNILSGIKLGGSENNEGTFQFVPSPQPDAYGSALLLRVTPGAFDAQRVQTSSSPELSYPTTLKIDSEQPVIYSFPDAVFDSTSANEQDGINRYIGPGGTLARVPSGPNGGDLRKNNAPSSGGNNGDGRIPLPRRPLRSSGKQKISVSTNIVPAHAVSMSGGTVAFQIGAPYAVVIDALDGSKSNEPPLRAFNDKPNTSFVMDYDFAVTSGTPDPNGNRVNTASYGRRAMIYAPNDVPSSGASTANPAFAVASFNMDGETVKFMRFFPNSLTMPNDETRGESDSSYTAGLGTPEVLA